MYKTTVNEENKIASKLFDELDLTPLEEELSKRVGAPITLFRTNDSTDRHFKAKITSNENVADKCGFLGNCVAMVLLQDFGIHVFKEITFDKKKFDKLIEEGKYDDADNLPRKTLGQTIQINIDARYYLKNGGSNGIHMLSVEFNCQTKEMKILD